MRVCFVIPTYNEADNITSLLERLAQLHPSPTTDFLVVDDESPDRTADRVRSLGVQDRRIHLISGQRKGIGWAYVRGLQHALDALQADVLVQMDADFSHPPEDAVRLLAGIEAGADVVIGSRYVDGGRVAADWPRSRRLLSRWGNRLARWFAGIAGVRDCTAGFKAIRASALRSAQHQDISVRGHVFQVALLHRRLRSGAQVVEVPIRFRQRAHGETKLGLANALEFFLTLLRLRIRRHQTLLRFSLVGLTGVAVNLGAFEALRHFGLNKFAASPIAIQLSVISNFLIHNYWTFAHRTMAGRKRVRGIKFQLASVVTLALSYGTFVGLSLWLPAASPVLLQAAGILPAAVLNYLLNTAWIFRAVPPTAWQPEAEAPRRTEERDLAG